MCELRINLLSVKHSLQAITVYILMPNEELRSAAVF